MTGFIDLEGILQRGAEKRVYLDIVFLVFLLALVTLLFAGRTPTTFGLLVFVVTWAFVYNEVGVRQFLRRGRFDDQRKEFLLENTTTGIQLPSLARLGLHVPVIVSGVVQAVNRARGDETYTLTREMGTSIITQAPESILYRPLSHPMPKKIIYLMQHVTAVLDNLTFLQFIPEGYRIRVLNKANANPLGLFPKSSRKNLFGAHFLETDSPERLRDSVQDFVRFMLGDREPTVYCIWPTGNLWKPALKNGIEEFKLGAFYMSCFTRIPVALVHTRIRGLVRKIIVEQSPLIHPPEIQNPEEEYLDFYENPARRPTVVGFRDRMESIYREMDDRLERELAE